MLKKQIMKYKKWESNDTFPFFDENVKNMVDYSSSRLFKKFFM